MRIFALACAMLMLVSVAPREHFLVVWGMEANEFPAHGSGYDFLAVFDIGADFGKLVAVVPTKTRAMMAHHSNEQMPVNHMLFAGDFMAGQGAVFDVTDPHDPRLAASFGAASGYTHVHSFERFQTATRLRLIKSKVGTAMSPARSSSSINRAAQFAHPMHRPRRWIRTFDPMAYSCSKISIVW